MHCKCGSNYPKPCDLCQCWWLAMCCKQARDRSWALRRSQAWLTSGEIQSSPGWTHRRGWQSRWNHCYQSCNWWLGVQVIDPCGWKNGRVCVSRSQIYSNYGRLGLLHLRLWWYLGLYDLTVGSRLRVDGQGEAEQLHPTKGCCWCQSNQDGIKNESRKESTKKK